MSEERRRGRPSIGGEPSERLDVRVPQTMFDALCRQAQRDGQPLAVLVRQALTRELRCAELRREKVDGRREVCAS